MESKIVRLTLDSDATYKSKMPSGEIKVGKNALKPMELLLTAVGGCSGVDVYEILKKKRQEVKSIEIEVEGVRRDTHPRIYTQIKIRYIVRGNVSEKAVSHAVKLSTEKYCSVLAMVKGSAEVKVEYEIWED